MILEMLHEGPCEVAFVKANGEQRVMKCTLKNSLIPEDKKPSGKQKKHNENQVRVFDLEKNEWRSFNKDRLFSMHKICKWSS